MNKGKQKPKAEIPVKSLKGTETVPKYSNSKRLLLNVAQSTGQRLLDDKLLSQNGGKVKKGCKRRALLPFIPILLCIHPLMETETETGAETHAENILQLPNKSGVHEMPTSSDGEETEEGSPHEEGSEEGPGSIAPTPNSESERDKVLQRMKIEEREEPVRSSNRIRGVPPPDFLPASFKDLSPEVNRLARSPGGKFSYLAEDPSTVTPSHRNGRGDKNWAFLLHNLKSNYEPVFTNELSHRTRKAFQNLDANSEGASLECQGGKDPRREAKGELDDDDWDDILMAVEEMEKERCLKVVEENPENRDSYLHLRPLGDLQQNSKIDVQEIIEVTELKNAVVEEARKESVVPDKVDNSDGGPGRHVNSIAGGGPPKAAEEVLLWQFSPMPPKLSKSVHFHGGAVYTCSPSATEQKAPMGRRIKKPSKHPRGGPSSASYGNCDGNQGAEGHSRHNNYNPSCWYPGSGSVDFPQSQLFSPEPPDGWPRCHHFNFNPPLRNKHHRCYNVNYNLHCGGESGVHSKALAPLQLRTPLQPPPKPQEAPPIRYPSLNSAAPPTTIKVTSTSIPPIVKNSLPLPPLKPLAPPIMKYPSPTAKRHRPPIKRCPPPRKTNRSLPPMLLRYLPPKTSEKMRKIRHLLPSPKPLAPPRHPPPPRKSLPRVANTAPLPKTTSIPEVINSPLSTKPLVPVKVAHPPTPLEPLAHPKIKYPSPPKILEGPLIRRARPSPKPVATSRIWYPPVAKAPEAPQVRYAPPPPPKLTEAPIIRYISSSLHLSPLVYPLPQPPRLIEAPKLRYPPPPLPKPLGAPVVEYPLPNLVRPTMVKYPPPPPQKPLESPVIRYAISSPIYSSPPPHPEYLIRTPIEGSYWLKSNSPPASSSNTPINYSTTSRSSLVLKSTNPRSPEEEVGRRLDLQVIDDSPPNSPPSSIDASNCFYSVPNTSSESEFEIEYVNPKINRIN